MNVENVGDAVRPSDPYDAFLLVSFGGPEGLKDVRPFLENVFLGKRVPSERRQQMIERYERFDGVSPINSQNRALLHALIGELNAQGLKLPVYWGNRNWHPLLTDTVGEMAEDGVHRALALVTSGFGSYPGCRQYLEDVEHARQQAGPGAPQINKIRLFYNHPGFIEAMADRVVAAFDELPAERRAEARLLFSAHSLPVAVAERSPYERQLREACRLVMEQIGDCPNFLGNEDRTSSLDVKSWQLAFQSRSGRPEEPWLEPTIAECLCQMAAEGLRSVVIVPLGFLAENLEIVYDLDVEVRELCEELGIAMVRAAVIGSHPRFVSMIVELILERIDCTTPRLALGSDGPWPDQCDADCCAPAVLHSGSR